MVKLFVYNSIGVNEIVSAESVGVENVSNSEWEQIDIDSGILKEFAVYDDVIRVKVEKGFNEFEVLDEVARIDEKVWG